MALLLAGRGLSLHLLRLVSIAEGVGRDTVTRFRFLFRWHGERTQAGNFRQVHEFAGRIG